MTTANKSKSAKATAKATSKASAEKTTPAMAAESQEATAAKDTRTKQEIFEASLNKVRTTGNEQVDAIAKKVVTAIHSGELKMDGSPEDGFSGNFNGKAPVTVARHVTPSKQEGKKETARYVLTVGEGEKAIEIGGGFAAKSFAFSRSQNRPVGAPTYNSEAVAAVSALLD